MRSRSELAENLCEPRKEAQGGSSWVLSSAQELSCRGSRPLPPQAWEGSWNTPPSWPKGATTPSAAFPTPAPSLSHPTPCCPFPAGTSPGRLCQALPHLQCTKQSCKAFHCAELDARVASRTRAHRASLLSAQHSALLQPSALQASRGLFACLVLMEHPSPYKQPLPDETAQILFQGLIGNVPQY